jgi:AraC family transcriptional regulator, arabinose operon regulatory protein
MTLLPEARIPPLGQLTTGHFHKRQKYFGWRKKGTADWLMIYTLSGRGRIGYGDGEFYVEKDEVILYRPSTPHDYGLEPGLRRWELLWAHFIPIPHWLPWMKWPEEAPGIMRLKIKSADIQKQVRSSFL